MDLRVLCVISLLCFVKTVHCQLEPEISKNILPEIRRVGETGRLNCTVNRKGNNKVYWVQDDKDQTLTADDKVDLEPHLNPLLDNGSPKYEVEMTRLGDATTFTLIIRRLELTDKGTYTCRVTIRGQPDNSPSKRGEMIVLSPPTIELGRTTQTVNVEEGNSALLTCAATGYPVPKISWVRPNGKAIPEPINKYTYMSKTLELGNVKKDDRGVYRCIADNDVRPPAMFDVRINVNFRPFARPVQATYGQAQNRQFDIVIECRVEGFPDPNLQWYKVEGTGLNPIRDDEDHIIHTLISHGHTLSISEFWFQLRILNVQANDYGDYVCEGSNKLGSHRATVTLYETSECQGPDCPAQGSHKSSGTTPSVSIATLLVFLTSLYLHM